MSPNNIKAVLFDFGGTLDSDGIPWKEHFHPFYEKAGILWPKEKFDRSFYASDDYLTEKDLKNTSYSETLKMQVDLVLKHGALNSVIPACPESSDDFKQRSRFRTSRNDTNRLVQTITNAFLKDSRKYLKRNLPLIRKLSQRYKLGIVSNFYGNLPSIFKEIGYAPYFGAVIDSTRVGYLKPDRRIFDAALNRLKVKAEEAVFVGDSPNRDMAGAKNIGMPHIWLDPNNRKPCCKGDRVIKKLTELERILL